MTAFAVFLIALAGGMTLVLRPFLGARRALRWPAEPPDERDDVARAVSSLRDLEFARAAGTIDPADHARLRRLIERSAFAATSTRIASPAPMRTFVVAAALAGIAAVLVAVSLPPAAGDRAPGAPLTGSQERLTPTTEELEARARAMPRDVPTLLALADAYRDEERVREAVATYQAVLAIDSTSVPALNGLGVILFASGELDGALLAADRVLALRPRDADALFLRGLVLYQRGDYAGAVETWHVFLEVGEFHPAAPMVRSRYDEARRRLGR